MLIVPFDMQYCYCQEVRTLTYDVTMYLCFALWVVSSLWSRKFSSLLFPFVMWPFSLASMHLIVILLVGALPLLHDMEQEPAWTFILSVLTTSWLDKKKVSLCYDQCLVLPNSGDNKQKILIWAFFVVVVSLCLKVWAKFYKGHLFILWTALH